MPLGSLLSTSVIRIIATPLALCQDLLNACHQAASGDGCLLSEREMEAQLPRVLQPASSFCFDLSALLPPHPFVGHRGGGAPVWSSKGDTVYILLVFDPKGELSTLPPEVSPLGDNLDFILEGVSFSP